MGSDLLLLLLMFFFLLYCGNTIDKMKKRISKNLFHFSHLVIELEKEKRKKTVFESILIQNQFQKIKIKIFELNFLFQIKKEISKSSFIFQFWL